MVQAGYLKGAGQTVPSLGNLYHLQPEVPAMTFNQSTTDIKDTAAILVPCLFLQF